MRIWIMAEDKEEKTTSFKEYFKSHAQSRDFIKSEIEYHKRNGVKAKAKIFSIEEDLQ